MIISPVTVCAQHELIKRCLVERGSAVRALISWLPNRLLPYLVTYLVCNKRSTAIDAQIFATPESLR